MPPLLCAHGQAGTIRSYRYACPVCGSFWDMDFIARRYEYDHDYPVKRGHYDLTISCNKVKTLKLWLNRARIDLRGKSVCEVGFGGGACLAYMATHSSSTMGIEAIESNIDNAASQGISKDRLFLFDALPDGLPHPVDLWVFQDSFEHLDAPSDFLAWMSRNSTAHAEVLIVAPDAGSPSCRMMGRLWPHKLEDHRFHWSRKGIASLFSSHGFTLDRSFSPVKYVSMGSIFRHVYNKLGRADEFGGAPLPGWMDFSVPFNIGEMGLIFRRVS